MQSHVSLCMRWRASRRRTVDIVVIDRDKGSASTPTARRRHCLANRLLQRTHGGPLDRAACRDATEFASTRMRLDSCARALVKRSVAVAKKTMS